MTQYVTMISADPRNYSVDASFPYDKMPERITKAATTPYEAASIVAPYTEIDEVITVYEYMGGGDCLVAYKKGLGD